MADNRRKINPKNILIMKKKILFAFALFALTLQTFSLNHMQTMDDSDRLAIRPYIPEGSEITGQARNQLLSKMTTIINLNGLAAHESTSYFGMIPDIAILSEDVTPTAPAMHAVTLLLSFKIVDNYSGNIFAETSLELRGVDQSHERALNQAFRALDTRAPQFKAFMENGKERIIAFYNTQCDMIITTAQSLVDRGRKYEAVELLTSIPPVNRECYDLCMEMAGEIGPVEKPKEEITITYVPEREPEREPERIPEQDSRASHKVVIDQVLFEIVSARMTPDYKVIIDIRITNQSHLDRDLGIINRTTFFDNFGHSHNANRITIGKESSGWGLIHKFISGLPTSVILQFDNIDPLVTGISLLEMSTRNLNGVVRLRNIDINKSQ